MVLLITASVRRGIFSSIVNPLTHVVMATDIIVGVSNPESIDVSEDEEFRGRLIGSSIGAAL